MIDNAMLSAMRQAIERLLPDTCTLQTVTRVSDGMGGFTETWATAYSDVACRLDMKQGVENVVGAGLRPYTRYMLSLPYDTTITTSYRVVHDSVTYGVVSVNTGQSWVAVKRVELETV